MKRSAFAILRMAVSNLGLQSFARLEIVAEEAEIVPARPVLDDKAIDNTPDVHVGPPDGHAGDLGPGEQGHGRGLMTASHRHVVDHELAFSDEMVVIDSDLFTEIVLDHREDLFPTVSALRT